MYRNPKILAHVGLQTEIGMSESGHAAMRADAMLEKGESNAAGQEGGLDGD